MKLGGVDVYISVKPEHDAFVERGTGFFPCIAGKTKKIYDGQVDVTSENEISALQRLEKDTLQKRLP
ncbi:MAG: hypothetical protein QE263_08185 [Vampirovibrionales bacterium]|nr:hypothetical protein [Vampirovibrionales bacterium]